MTNFRYIREFAKLQGVSRQSVYDAVKSNKLTAQKLGNSLFIIEDEKAKSWKPRKIKKT